MSTVTPRSLKALLGEPDGNREDSEVLDFFLAGRPEIGQRLLDDLQGTGLDALYHLDHMSRKFMFLRLGLGTNYPQTIKQAAQTLSLSRDEALALEDDSLFKLEKILGAKKIRLLEDLLPTKEVEEPKPENPEDVASAEDEVQEAEEPERGEKKPPKDALCDKELGRLFKKLPVFLAYVLRKRLGLDSKPMTIEQIANELKNRPETVKIFYLRAVKALGQYLTPEAIATLEARMPNEKPAKPDQAQVLGLGEVQAAIASPEAPPTDETKSETDKTCEVDMENINFATVSGQELVNALHDVLLALTPRSISTLRMRLGIGVEKPMTVGEIATASRKSVQAIYSSYTSARSMMRKILGRENADLLEKRMPKDGTRKLAVAPVIPLPRKAKPAKLHVVRTKPTASKQGAAKAAAFRKSVKYEKRIAKAIAALPDRLRRVAELRSDGLTLPEIAEKLGITYTSAATISSDAFTKLKKLMQDSPAYKSLLLRLANAKRGEKKAFQARRAQTQAAEPNKAASPPSPPVPPESPSTETSAPIEQVDRIKITIEIPRGLLRDVCDLARSIPRLEASFEAMKAGIDRISRRGR